MAERAASAGVTATVTQAAEFWRGAKDTLPLILGAIPFGVLFGALAMSAGMTVAATLGMSLLVFAGSSQFVAMGLFAQGVAVAVIVLTTFIVNLRHALYSASLAPYMRHLPQAWLAPLGFWLTDESFAVVIKRYRARDASPYKHWYFLGSALAMYGNWQLCTVIGIIAGTQLQGMTDWGLEFAMVVTFIGIVVPMLLTKPMVLAALAAGVVAVLARDWPHQSGLMVAAGAGVAAGVLAQRVGDWRASRRSGESRSAVPARRRVNDE